MSMIAEPGRAADQTMREEIARALCEADGKNPDAVWIMTMVPPDVLRWREYACKADAILSGPLAPILQESAQLRARLHEAEKGAEAVREAVAKLVETFPEQILAWYSRGPGSPPGNGYRATTRADLAAAIRGLPLTPAPEANQEAGDGR